MILHKHHIIPRHAGGTDDSANIVELTIEEHAEAHKKLYEEHGRWQDFLAWKGLSGQIGNDEIKEEFIRLYRGEAHHMFGKKRPDHAELMRIRMTGENNPMFGKSAWNKGLTYTSGPNPLKGHSGEKNPMYGKHMTLTCPHCNKTGGRMMLRWHFNNCRELNKTEA